MKAFNDVLNSNTGKAGLICGVLNQIGITNVMPVIELGAGAGFARFIYEHDKTAFYRRQRKNINLWITEIAKIEKVETVSYICTLMGETWAVRENQKNDIEMCLSSERLPQDPITYVESFLALWAVEQVCRLFLPVVVPVD